MVARQTIDIRDYYASLLVQQYIDRPRAFATVQAHAAAVIMPNTSVQVINFDAIPVSGSFVVNWKGNASLAINWNDSEATVRSRIAAIIPGITASGITGSPAARLITVVFDGVYTPPPQDLLTLTSNTLLTSTSDKVPLRLVETDEILPIAVQNSFAVDTAVGAQLDIIAKYIGVTRTAKGFTTGITLGDTDFRQLIRMGIVKNSSNADLASIQALLQKFFPGQIFITDYRTMRISYSIDTTVGSTNLLQLFVTEGLLPRPMGVAMSVVGVNISDTYFGTRTYTQAAPFGELGFNSYSSYSTSNKFLTYASAILQT